MLVLPASTAFAQNSIQLFGPVDVRLSTTGTGTTIPTGNNFNTTNLNLVCPASPTGVLSSTADSTGNLMVDNFLNVTVTSGQTTTGPTNVCPGGGTLSCYSPGYQVPASQGLLTGVDPDTFVATGGVAPITISQLLVAGPIQVQVALEDVGYGNNFFLAGSTVYLNTNCTQGGVTGPALVNGNPISATAPTPQQLTQDFSFNPLTGQEIGFEYDLSTAQSAGSLTINDGTIPQVSDTPLDPALFQSQYAAGTSFATSSCIIHAGELLPTGAAACKLFTLQCSVGTGASATGAQCPVSTQKNEIFQDVFSGPGFTLSDIPTPNGPTFHEGIGLLMASDGWPGGACNFNTEADLGDLNCPQNLLTSFTTSTDSANDAVRRAAARVGAASAQAVHANATTPPKTPTISTGTTTRPNSTFISVAQVPEDLTTVTVAGQMPGYWVKSANASVTLSSQPPNLSGTTLAGAASFVPSPIQSITYGISTSASVPAAGAPVAGDLTLSNTVGCPVPPNLTSPAATAFTPDPVSFTGLADGKYLIHYFAEDCAGTEELLFTQDANSNWSTSFYTYPLNVDTTAPVVAMGPTLAPAGASYTVGESVMASYRCTDALSGVVQCGSQMYAVGATNDTGTVMSPVDTSSVGAKTYTVTTVDAAGNTTSASVNYQVTSTYDNQVQFSITPSTVNYGQDANVTVQIVAPAASANVVKSKSAKQKCAPINGTVKIYDGTRLIDTLRVNSSGLAKDSIGGFGVGTHSLTAAYSGDATIAAGTSAPATLTVKAAPVRLDVGCFGSTLPYGADYLCGVFADAGSTMAQGVVTYTYDGGAPVKAPLEWGVTVFAIAKPAVGQHKVVVSYAAQGSFAAAAPVSETFTVTAGSGHR